jgi:hypothetical protein
MTFGRHEGAYVDELLKHNHGLAYLHWLKMNLSNPPKYLQPTLDNLDHYIKLNTVMPFGVHKGVRLSSVPADYLTWLMGYLDKGRDPLLYRAALLLA